MIEFIVIVESDADARIATHLAERVLLEKIDWLETSLLPNLFRWSGLEENSDRSCWRDALKIINNYKISGLHMPRFLRRKKIESPLKSDEARTMKILNLIQALQHQSNRQIRAVLFIRDLDHQRWETTPLQILRERGVCTGLTAYLDEIEQRLVPIIID